MSGIVLLLGPYIGSLKEEIMTFLPYARWLANIVEHDSLYVSTHINRFFLYEDFVDIDNLIPVYKNLSRNELQQVGYINKSISRKNFDILIKDFKDNVIDYCGCRHKDIELYGLNYVKSTPPIFITSKIFKRVNHIGVDIPEEHKNRILFIPDNSGRVDIVYDVWNHLKEKHDAILIGDMNTLLSEQNVILSRIDYFESGLKYIYKYITEAKAVICPASHWSVIANLQKVPLFSWCSYHPHIYRENGMYNFKNDNCSCLAINDAETIKNSIDGFLENL